MQTLTLLPVWAWIGISTIFFAGGEYLSKRFALHPGVILALYILCVYALSTLTWLPAIFEEQKLAVIGTIWIIIGLAADLFIGLVMFHEKLDHWQVLGLVFGAVGVVLLSL
ncbi:MAG: hypothetical protein ACREGH_04370 [Minisyncoccia bacterium]